MKKLITAVLLLCSSLSWGQDLEFSQFYSNPIYLNPALAGTHGCPRFAMNYRNQWPQLSGQFISYAASYDQYFDNISGGFGINLMNDQSAGNTFNHSAISLMYSYHLNINRKWTALFGAQATWNQKFLDWDKLTFGDMIDPRRGFIYGTGDVPRGGSKGFFDASAGVVVFNKFFNVGFTGKHLNRPNESLILGDSRMPIRLTAHASATIPLGSKSKYSNSTAIMPSLIYTYQQGMYQLNVGTYVKYGVFTAGAWLRSRDAFILTLGLTTETFKVGYSYDITVSPLNNGVSGGAHEVSLGLNLRCKTKVPSFRTISCPSF